MRTILISAALLSAVSMSAPAAAQYGNYNRGYVQGQNIDRQLNAIFRRIDRASERRLISPNEARRLYKEGRQIDRLQDRYSRNGLTAREHQDLQIRINRLQQRLRFERQEGRQDRRWY